MLEFLGYSEVEDVEGMKLRFSKSVFAADNGEQVDALHDLLVKVGATVLGTPAEYDYLPGYYAVFFADPDGMKFEFVHVPPPA